MTRHVCIHAHFYQPDRTNPWTGRVDRQPSAAPRHDWNERVAAECYTPNSAARILGPGGKVARRVNNYERLSFNFGATLLAWLERHVPATYQRILAADRAGRARFDGHGPAIAQPWAHSILPLDSDRDRRTQVRWGIRDFEFRFGRPPEGMWLPETAVDIPALEALAEAGIRFTILAPHQATAAPGAPGPHRCALPSGREIALFRYDGAISHAIAFGDLLDDGERMAGELLAAAESGGFASVATDGETYGHHHKFGEMALAHCLDRVERETDARLTVFGQYVAEHPARDPAAVVERTSWSCVHGVERWRRGCGCSTGLHPGWQLGWRAPLRAAVEWLRDALTPVFEERLEALVRDPWALRDDYIEVILDASAGDALLARHLRDSAPARPAPLPPLHSLPLEGEGRVRVTPRPRLADADRARLLGLLEMQRWALLSFTSCGWFFDDISELTSVQVMRCAARAMELCREHTGLELEEGFTDILYNARSNIPELGTGADIYRRFARAGT